MSYWKCIPAQLGHFSTRGSQLLSDAFFHLLMLNKSTRREIHCRQNITKDFFLPFCSIIRPLIPNILFKFPEPSVARFPIDLLEIIIVSWLWGRINDICINNSSIFFLENDQSLHRTHSSYNRSDGLSS